MKYTHEETDTNFTVKDRPTVLEQMGYSNLLFENRSENNFWRNWVAAQSLITDWESKVIEDPNKLFKEKPKGHKGGGLFLDEETNPQIAHLIMYVGNTVMVHVSSLENLEKN